MLSNRLAAAAQAAGTLVALTTATPPTALGSARGPVTIALGGAYIAACLAVIARPTDTRALATVASLGVTWWTARSLSLLTARPVPWAEVSNTAVIATLVALYSWRSLFRTGFLARLTELEAKATANA